jgi:hypothetical protein
MENYETITKRILEVADLIKKQKNPNQIMISLSRDEHLRAFTFVNDRETVCLTLQRIPVLLPNRFPSTNYQAIGKGIRSTAQTQHIEYVVSEEEENTNTATSTTENEEEMELTKISEISRETIEEKFVSCFPTDHNEIVITILTDFLNNLVEYEDEPTSTAFMYRCYLTFAREKHHTNAKDNVIKDVKKFKMLLNEVIGQYEVKDTRSRGWKLAVPK